MFSPAFREHVREWLIEMARADPAVTAAALVGSAASGREDAWSDIDLALRLAEDADPAAVAHDWSTSISRKFNVADQLDIYSDATLFRVFLLAETLQVDISFWPDSRFAASGRTKDGPRLVELPHDDQLHAAFRHVSEALLLEARHVDVRLATGLQDALREIVRTSRSTADHGTG